MRLIDADALIDKCGGWYVEEGTESGFIGTLKNLLATMPTIQPVATDTNVGTKLGTNLAEVGADCISRQAAIRWIKTECNPYGKPTLDYETSCRIMEHLDRMPSAQPEHTCVNCGRTANNGGWYEDGRTRCPIEEHYALPKDGYCHLWEKRKDWEDDYVKRAEEGEK